MPHPVVHALKAYEWAAGQAAISDQTLCGLGKTPGVPTHIRDSHTLAHNEWLTRLDAAHREVMRRLGRVD